ncbi:unnamed protein product [Allacma fusca]|uniref:Reverse transcriptase Ty1/copia-type domain-containing protein n=1 Tax=Allacma fusca TaxID=39272 RepID=A0A8J2KR41_9HEXA|nr:unnamed protein product [Allacma fusca]
MSSSPDTEVPTDDESTPLGPQSTLTDDESTPLPGTPSTSAATWRKYKPVSKGRKTTIPVPGNHSPTCLRDRRTLMKPDHYKAKLANIDEQYESTRLLLYIVASQRLAIPQFNVKTAFAHGKLYKEMDMEQTEEYEVGGNVICKLKKRLYGLKQEPRCWSQTFAKFLAKCKLQPSTSDPSVYNGNKEDTWIFLALYVDDGLITCTSEEMINQVLSIIQGSFEIKICPLSTYIGIEMFKTDAETLCLRQGGYVLNPLKKFNISNCSTTRVSKQPNTILLPGMTADNGLPYRPLVGSLVILAKCT